MKVKEIQDIINFIKKTDLDDVSIETENYKIRVKKNNAELVSEIRRKAKDISTQISDTSSENHEVSKNN